MRRGRRNDELGKRANNDPALEGEVPVLKVFDIAGDPVLNVLARLRFSAKTAHLGESGDSWLDEGAHLVVRHQLGKLFVMLDQMRPRPDHAHVSAKDIPELRHLIDAEFPEPLA